MLLAITMMSVCMFVSAQEVNMPFDYYNSGVGAYAKAVHGNVTVMAGEYGLIQTIAEDGSVRDIKDVCDEDIYYLNWVDGEFVAFSKNYKMTSPDGYAWTTESNTDWEERQKCGIQNEKTQEIEVMQMANTVELNTYVDRDREDGEAPTVNILYTGKEYIKIEDYHKRGWVPFDRKLYTSPDRENWMYVKTLDGKELSRNGKWMFLGIPVDSDVQIINTGKEYLVRGTNFDYTLKDHRAGGQNVTVFDLDFNYVKRIEMDDYIVDMSYVDGVYYLTTNKSITYQSTDLENWAVFGEEIGVPLNNGTKTLYKTHIPLNKDVLWDEYSYCYYEGPILEEGGVPSKNVVLEGIELYGMRVIGDYFVAVSMGGRKANEYTADDNIRGVDGLPLDIKRNYTSQPIMVHFSKDGIYWASQKVSPGSLKTISQTEENMIVEMLSAGRTMNFKFSDMEAAVPKSDLRVQLNNRILGFSTPPVMEEDRMLVPMRFLFEQMGAEVNWDENTQTATATVPVSADAQLRTFGAETAKSVTFAIDNTMATVNGSTAEMDVPARLVNDKTMVPLRFLSENLGCTVDWDEATNTAIITTNN